MNPIMFAMICFTLLMSVGYSALLLRANYYAMYMYYKDGKTVINWNTRGEGRFETFLLAGILVLGLISTVLFVTGV